MNLTKLKLREKRVNRFSLHFALLILALSSTKMIYSQTCYCFTQTHLDYRKIDDFPKAKGNNTQFISNIFEGDFYASSPKRNAVNVQLYDVFNNLYSEQSSWIKTNETGLACYKTESEALKKRRSCTGDLKSQGWTVIDFTLQYIMD